MMAKDTQLHQAQENIQTIWRFLEAVGETHSPLDYQRLATPYLLHQQPCSLSRALAAAAMMLPKTRMQLILVLGLM